MSPTSSMDKRRFRGGSYDPCPCSLSVVRSSKVARLVREDGPHGPRTLESAGRFISTGILPAVDSSKSHSDSIARNSTLIDCAVDFPICQRSRQMGAGNIVNLGRARFTGQRTRIPSRSLRKATGFSYGVNFRSRPAF